MLSNSRTQLTHGLLSIHRACTIKRWFKRNHVRQVDPTAIRWFPGHMRKGMNDINAKMANVDVIIEVHDARIPFTGRSNFLQNFGQVRPHILLMNKFDLAEHVSDMKEFRQQLMMFSRSFGHDLSDLYFTQLNSPEKQKRLLQRLIRRLPTLAKQTNVGVRPSAEFPSSSNQHGYATNAGAKASIMTMALGIPNSGKSTLINALRAVGRGGSGRASRVGRMAGQTRSISYPVVIARGSSASVQHRANQWLEHDSSGSGVADDASALADMRILIMDTPGILEPSGRTLTEQLSLCVCGAIDWNGVDRELLVDYLLFWWNHRNRTEYVSVLNLPQATDSITELLARVCAANSFFLPMPSLRPAHWEASELESLAITSPRASAGNRVEPDMLRAAEFVLKRFSNGDFGRTTFTSADEQAASSFFVPIKR